MLSWLSRSLIVHSTNDCIFVLSGSRRFTVHVQKEPAANVAGFTSGQTSDQAAISGFRPDKKKKADLQIVRSVSGYLVSTWPI